MQDLLEEAKKLHKERNLDLAEQKYLQVLNQDPKQAEAWFSLGVLHLAKNNLSQAGPCLVNCLRLSPAHVKARCSLGGLYLVQGQLAKAKNEFKAAIFYEPNNSDAQNNLGVILNRQGQLSKAQSAFYAALKADPENLEAHTNLALLYKSLGNYPKSLEHFKEVLRINPGHAPGYRQIGLILNRQDRPEQAIEYLNKARELDPENIELLLDLGLIYKNQGYMENSARTFRKIISLEEKNPKAHNYLGLVYTEQGKIKEALDCYKQAFSLAPQNMAIHSNLLFVTNYFPDSNAKELMKAHQEWEKLHCPTPVRPPARPRPAQKKERIKIGFVSADFRKHPVSNFFLPLISSLNPDNFFTCCYSDYPGQDSVTKQIQEKASIFKQTAKMSYQALAELIRSDGIHILVELSGHTGQNRLLTLAEKPAPIQATWLGYPNTTGLSAIDYRITDFIADPEGSADRLSSEKLLRLSEGFLCFQPLIEDPERVKDPPCCKEGKITFGSFNNLAKINPKVVSFWSRLLKKVPQSRLIFKSRLLADEPTKKRFKDMFKDCGLNCRRVEFLDYVKDSREHLETYNRVDLALDPFPYNGTTTTCEAIFMGVPVVTLYGDRHAGRVSSSILTNIGHPELIAYSFDQYIEIVQDLCANQNKLAQLRKSLPRDLLNSSLRDPKGFARKMESLFFYMYEQWLYSQS